MAEGNYIEELTQKFSSPEEEIKFLRDRIAIREKELGKSWEKVDKESVIREEMRRYAKAHPDDVLEKGYKMIHSHAKEIVLELSPETHDKKIEELLSILMEKGLKNVLSIVSLMGNPHIEDDFHRFLVQYIKAGFVPKDVSEKDPIVKVTHHTLFEVSFPSEKEENEKPLKELISSMEQWYEGMILSGEKESIALELSNPEGSKETSFFVAVSDRKKVLLEKQLLSVFPRAKIVEVKDDYNIFNYDGVVVLSEGVLSKNGIFPIKTYEDFDYDPLNVILNAFSKLNKDGEGASFQMILTPDSMGYLGKYRHALKNLQEGVPLKKAINVSRTLIGDFAKGMASAVGDEIIDVLWGGKAPKTEQNNEQAIEQIKKKVETPIMLANLRIVASAENRSKAEDLLDSLQASFNQFENSNGNSILWKKASEKEIQRKVRYYSYRAFDDTAASTLSVKEITSMIHFPQGHISSPHLKSATSRTSPAPTGLSEEGILLGINKDRGSEQKIFMSGEDRLRHFYTIGQTGTGKTTFLKNMIAQDIKNGEGVCMIDPHGNDIQDILSIIPPERYDDLIYFDPGYTDRPMALNMLEYDPVFPEQKTFVVNELLSIFNKLFDMKVAGGPMFEQYFRNSVMLVMEDPESGNTLFDVSRVLASKQFRDLKLSRCKNPVVTQFWTEIANKAGGEASLANMVPYITSKFDVFLSNDIMRPIISQEKSVFNFRDIMDNKKILLVNLSKGKLGDINSNLIGLILVGKFLMAALSRADSFNKELAPFYLYIDEFQNITTNSISQILSEARKYKLSLAIAHQFIAQLSDEIKDAVFGNVGSIASFRVGADDAEYLEKQFSPVFEAYDLMNVDNHNAYIKMLSKGKPVRPFSILSLPFNKGNISKVEKLKELSYLIYGKDRGEVEETIRLKYEATKAAPPAPLVPPLPSKPLAPLTQASIKP